MEKRQQDKAEMEIDLIELAKALWQRAWAIGIAVAIFGSLFFFKAAFLTTPLYRASAMLYVNNGAFSLGETSVSISPGQLTAAQSLVETYVVILKSRTTLEKVAEEAGVPYSYEQMNSMIVASPVTNTEIFEVSVTSSKPREAELIANTVAEVLPDRIADIVDGSSVRVVDYAVTPTRKVSPSITRNTALGMMLGFVLSCGVIVILKIFDTTISSVDYLVQNYDLPILAVIPDMFPKKPNDSGYYKKSSSAENKRKEGV